MAKTRNHNLIRRRPRAEQLEHRQLLTTYFESFNDGLGGWSVLPDGVESGTSVHQSLGGVNDSGYLGGTREHFAPNFNQPTGMSKAMATGDLNKIYGDMIDISYDARLFDGIDIPRSDGEGPHHLFYGPNFKTGWLKQVAEQLEPFRGDWTRISFSIDTSWSDQEAIDNGWTRTTGDGSWSETLTSIDVQFPFYGLGNGTASVNTGIDNFQMASAPSFGEIHGAKFHDLNGDGERILAETILVSSFRGDELLRYDAADGSLLGGLPITRPYESTVGLDGDIYVARNSTASGPEDEIWKFDGATGEFLEVFASGNGLQGPVDLVFGPNGDLYVSNNPLFGGPVLRFNGQTGKFISGLAHPGENGIVRTGDIFFNANGELLVENAYVGASANGTIQLVRFDPETGGFLGELAPIGDEASPNPWAPSDYVFGPDGHIYATDTGILDTEHLGDAVLRYDGITGEFIDFFVAPGGGRLRQANSLAFGSNGDLYVASSDTHEVLRYDGETGNYIDTVVNSGASFPIGISFQKTFEPAVQGFIIYLDTNRNEVRDDAEPWTVTDDDGNYSFTGLSLGTYVVREEQQPGWLQTSPQPEAHEITVEAGTVNSGIDFGNRQMDVSVASMTSCHGW